MEEVNTQDQIAQSGPPQASSFGSSSSQKSSSAKWLIIFILLLALGGAGIYFFATSGSAPIATPTPSFGVVPIDNNIDSTPEPVSTSTPAAVDKEEITIEIQNGTGIAGEAAFLQGKLKTLGYSEITASNASSTDHTATTVTFLTNLSKTVQDEIKAELEKIYTTVNVKTASSQKADVIIITGTRSGASPKATSTSTASPKSSATPASTPQ